MNQTLIHTCFSSFCASFLSSCRCKNAASCVINKAAVHRTHSLTNQKHKYTELEQLQIEKQKANNIVINVLGVKFEIFYYTSV